MVNTMIPKQFLEYYGDQTRWFLGEVVNVKDDPLQIGRVRVKIFGVYDEIDEPDLPWAQVVIPVTHGVSSYGKEETEEPTLANAFGKFGKTSVSQEPLGQYLGLLVGTHVFGIFLDGKDSQLPLVLGSLPKKGDNNQRATENYPHNKIYQTEQGHFKEYDDTPENTRIREQHMSGTYTEMEHDGSMRTEVQKDQYIRVKGDVTIKGDQDASITIEGNCNINVTGDATITGKNVSVTAEEKATVRAGGKVVLG